MCFPWRKCTWEVKFKQIRLDFQMSYGFHFLRRQPIFYNGKNINYLLSCNKMKTLISLLPQCKVLFYKYFLKL